MRVLCVTSLHRLAGLLPIMACVMIGVPLRAQECGDIAANANIVEVSADKDRLAGSGVILTYDGYVVTAAHILLGKLQPPIPLRYYVRLRKRPDGPEETWRSASLCKLDRNLDLAILKLDEFADRPPLVAMPPSASAAAGIGSVCLSGFGLRKDGSGAVVRLGFASVPSALLPGETGYLIPQTNVQSGYSGGGAFHDGRFAGLILRRRLEGGSYVVPGDYVVDFVGSLGIYVDHQGRFTPGVPPQALRKEIQGNRASVDENSKQIARILRSMEWEIALLPPAAGDDFKIVLRPRRAFPDQILDGYFLADLIVHFDDDRFRQRLSAAGTIHKAVVSAKIEGSEVLIEHLERDIDEIKAKYYEEGLNLNDAPIQKFLIRGRISYQGWTRELSEQELKLN